MIEQVTTARAQLKAHCDELLRRANVVATGVGYKVTAGARTDIPSIVCSVEKKLPSSRVAPGDLVPAEVGGVPTDVIETGRIRIFQAPTGRFRPAPGGVSVGHKDITAGTLGCWVKRKGQWMMLSNNHVLANSNEAHRGDAILQPGPHDGGKNPADQIATLEDFIPIHIQGADVPSDCNIAGSLAKVLNALAEMAGSGTRMRAVKIQAGDNRVDAAIARPLSEEDVQAEILKIGAIQGQAQGELGMKIKKSGRTTGYTEGEIEQVDVTVNVQYGTGRLARFTDQLLAGAMSQPGDSGSAVLDDNNRLVGLLFAGSDNSTIINRIENVFSALDLTL
ncbi:MAG TPA: hypothetical protein ENJ19_00285 [Gammaproteobacteria bacterium]|nr:hypothetical protein [Gammaproteobacteria bacterium]